MRRGIVAANTDMPSNPSNAAQDEAAIGTYLQTAANQLAAIRFPAAAEADAVSAETALSNAAAATSPTVPPSTAVTADNAVSPALTRLNTDLGIPPY
jgi:hypothetical protein